MAKIRLHPGVWTNFAAISLGGGGAVTAASSAQVALQCIGWAGMASGAGLLLWGVTVDGEHWWRRWLPGGGRPSTEMPPVTLLTAEPNRLILWNRGQTSFWLSGTLVEGDVKSVESTPRLVPKDAFYYLLTNNLEPWLVAKFGKNAKEHVPVEFYLEDENRRQKYVAKCSLYVIIDNGQVVFHPQNLGMEREDWR
jgi:hypothetical protein